MLNLNAVTLSAPMLGKQAGQEAAVAFFRPGLRAQQRDGSLEPGGIYILGHAAPAH